MITGHRSTRTLTVYDTNKKSSKVHQKCQNILKNVGHVNESSETCPGKSCTALVPSKPSAVLAASDSSTSLVPSNSSTALVPSDSSTALVQSESSFGVQYTSSQQISNVAIQPHTFGAHQMFSGAMFSHCVFNMGTMSTPSETNK